MAYKKKSAIEPISKLYQLPSEESDLRTFIEQNKINMMEHIVDSVEYAIKNKLDLIEVFQFKDSEFVIMVSRKDFLDNIDNVYDHYIRSEKYELCDRVVSLQKEMRSKIILNEKTKSLT